MTDLSALSAASLGAGGAASAAPAEEPEASSRNALTADFDTFLTLLTTQMRNQDPLNPIESTEFVAQLAQFSSVEQQVRTNELLGDLISSLAAASAGALGDWIGREVRAEAPTPYDGAPVEVWPPAPPEGAPTATLVVRDAAGAVVREIGFPPADESVTWDGKRADGAEAEKGDYGFSVRFGEEGGATTNLPAQTFQRVVEARRTDGEPMLRLAGGAVVAADAVGAVR